MHFDPRDLDHWDDGHPHPLVARAKRHRRARRLLVAVMAGTIAAAILWSLGAYDELLRGSSTEATR